MLFHFLAGQNIQLAQGESWFMVQWIQAGQNCESTLMISDSVFPSLLYLPANTHTHFFFLQMACFNFVVFFLSLSKLFSHLSAASLRFASLVLSPFHCLIPSAFNRPPSSLYSSWLLSLMPSAAELRGRGGELHQRSADDLPQAAELRRSAELHLYLPSVGGLVWLQGWQLWQGAALPGLQWWGDVLRQQSLHQAADGRLLGKDPLQNFVRPITCFCFFKRMKSSIEKCHTKIFFFFAASEFKVEPCFTKKLNADAFTRSVIIKN